MFLESWTKLREWMAPSSYGIREFAYAFGLVSSNGAAHTRQPALLGVEILVVCLQADCFHKGVAADYRLQAGFYTSESLFFA